jgi:thiol:disulfide interchange protein DsbD
VKGTVAADAKPGRQAVNLSWASVMVCSEVCFSSKFTSAEFEVLPGPAPAGSTQPVSPPPVQPQATPKLEKVEGLTQKLAVPVERYAAELDAVRQQIAAKPVEVQGGLLGLLLTAVFWGFVSLATPCVFPMIPITVSLFLKQSGQSVSGAVRLAAVYSLTIVVVLGLSAVTLLSVFRRWSVSPEMNLFLGVLFLVFALSFLGLFDLTLPGFLVRGAESRRKAGGIVGTVFGAVAFSLVSFTCVAPFLGGFAGIAASGGYSQLELALAGLAFAAAVASPFFLLALFPSLLKALPKAGGWLDAVKAVFGFVELAAALKFFRTAELRLLDRPAYFTYDLCLAGWVAIAAACGLYLLHLYRLPHDYEDRPAVGVPRLLVALLFLGFAAYLTPALFKHRPAGAVYAWVDAFLLPEPAEAAGGDELPWSTDLKGAIDRIQREKRASGTSDRPLVFVDFTGVTCTNCKLNEKDVFPRPAIRDLLKKYTLVSLYTDEVPAAFYAGPVERLVRKEEAAANLGFQKALFGTEQLPLYAVLDPKIDGSVSVVGVYDEGKINDVPRFAEFLREPLKKQ